MRDRARANRCPGNLEELTVPLERLVRQRLDDNLRRLDESWPRLFHRDAKAGVLHARGAAPEAEQAAAARDDVEQRDLLGDADGIVPRQHDDGRAERDASRPAGVVAQELGRGRRHGVAGKVMLQRPQRVEPERLGEIAERHVLAEHRRVGQAFLRQHVERDADFHDRPPRSIRFALR